MATAEHSNAKVMEAERWMAGSRRQRLSEHAMGIVAKLALIAATVGYLIGVYRLALQHILN